MSFSKQVNELKTYRTNDGSFTLYSSEYKEGFHNSNGALKESQDKYLNPAQIDLFSQRKKINILDVCFGLGYNSGCIIQSSLSRKIQIEWHGLEIDQRPLNLALNNEFFLATWSPTVLNFFYSIQSNGGWINEENKGEIYWGDARKKIYEVNKSIKFDLILLDPFSPQKCPELWSEEFLSLLSDKLSINGRLITYSSAASIRASLIRSGLKIYSISPTKEDQNKWSYGTVAMRNPLKKVFISKTSQFKELSLRELEHLKTRSSIPYRDPSGEGNAKEIILNREKEQLKSSLTKTSLWRKQWNGAK